MAEILVFWDSNEGEKHEITELSETIRLPRRPVVCGHNPSRGMPRQHYYGDVIFHIHRYPFQGEIYLIAVQGGKPATHIIEYEIVRNKLKSFTR